jgi:hypothetical protein
MGIRISAVELLQMLLVIDFREESSSGAQAEKDDFLASASSLAWPGHPTHYKIAVLSIKSNVLIEFACKV